MATDAGLRKFMLGVYNKLGLGILLAGVLPTSPARFRRSPNSCSARRLSYVVQWGPVVLLLGSMFFMKNPSPLGDGHHVLGHRRDDGRGPRRVGADGGNRR
jgi:FtsH-binding integral membrane protein